MNQTAQWYRLACACPKCRHRPTDRYSRSAVERAMNGPLEEPLKNVRCKCGAVYLIAWVALAYAEPLSDQQPDPDIPWAA